jgi:hypothetical protein
MSDEVKELENKDKKEKSNGLCNYLILKIGHSRLMEERKLWRKDHP